MTKILHPVKGLEFNDNWKIQESTTGSGTRFIPKLNGRPLMRRDGQSATVAWFTSMDEANAAVTDFLSRQA